MKFKRLLSLMLCFVMLATTALTTGCQKEEEVEEEVKTGATTLNMFIITEDETTDEQAKAVQLAINELTIKKLKTIVKINFLKESEYFDKIEETLLEIEEFENEKDAEEEEVEDIVDENGETVENDESAEVDDETVDEEATEKKEITNDDLIEKIRNDGDVILEKPQIDIIVFNNYDTYRAYANTQKLAPLDQYLTLDAKILNSYIYPTYLEAAKLGGSATYGIPVNGAIGTYEYFVFDKALVNKYGFDVSTVKDFADLEGYLEIIKNGENNNNIVPLNRGTSPANYEFFSNEGSPLGIFWDGNDIKWPENILYTYTEPEVVEHYRTINRFRQAGYLPDENTPEDARFAVQILEGTIESPENWEEIDGRDYECVIYKTPKITNESMIKGVFGISAKSYNKAKAMELIKELQTDKELINTLQWGIEGVHYNLNDENDGMGTITLVSNSGYKMNTNYTGNKYLKYRVVGEPYEFEAQKLQNLDMSTYGGLAGFNPVLTEKDEEVLQNANAIVAKYYPDLVSGKGNFDELMTNILAELNVVYSVGPFETFISHKIGGSYNLYVDAMKLAYGIETVENESEAE